MRPKGKRIPPVSANSSANMVFTKNPTPKNQLRGVRPIVITSYSIHYTKLYEQHLRLGSKWDKQVAYFYNAPWKEQNLDSLKTAETCYNAALYYWNEAKIWAEKANVREFKFLFLTDLQEWEDERERIGSGDLNYERTIGRELARLEKVRAAFLAMDENTY